MPVKLRLRRQGRKGQPYYAIVAADSRSPRDGKYLEKVGSYNPVSNPAEIKVDTELAIKWLKNGAQPTNTVKAILRYTGVNLKYALIKQGKTEDEVEKIYNKWLDDKASLIQAKKEKITSEMASKAAEALKAEAKVREAREAELKAKSAPVVEEVAEEAVEEVATEEVVAEAEEQPVAEAEEQPAAEAEAPAEEEKTEE